MQYVTENSVPKQIVSDRGFEFISELFQTVCRKLKAQSKLTISYHPICNGMAGKANSTIKKAMSRLASEDKNSWDETISLATLAINTAYKSRIQNIPFFLFHGRDARFPYEEIFAEQLMNYAVDESYAA